MAIDREKVLVAAQKFVEKKKYDKAVVEYQKLIQEDPNDARTLLKIGDLQSKMEAYADAIGTYERVGKHYASQGFALKAIAVYKQIRELIGKHVPQLEERYGHITPKLAELYQQLGLTSDALAALDEVATRLQRQQRDGEAIDVFRKIVELDPTNPLPHLRLAEALSRIKDIDGAVGEFGVAAAQLIKLGRRDDALKVIERLLHHKQDVVQARIAAELYLARGQAQDGMQALAKLQLCFQANPRDLDTLALLARAFGAIGQASKGIEVQKEMARIARDTGKTDLYAQLIDRLSKLAPHDEGVRKLVAGGSASAVAPQQPPGPPPRLPAPPPPPVRGANVDELSYEAVETHDLIPEPPQPPSSRRHEAHRPQPPPYVPPRYQAPEPELEYADDGAAELIEEDDQGQLEVIEEDAPHDADASEQLAQVLADASSFRRVRLYAKAIETLRLGLEIEPRSIEVREFLRDILLETGQHDEAVVEMLTVASLLIDALDGEGAARILQDVLGVDPQNTRAVEMLRELGYEYVDEGAPEEVYAEDLGDPHPTSGDTESQQRYADPYRTSGEAPLPSYDLEEMGPADVSDEYSDPRVIRSAPQQRGRVNEVDDPFGGDSPLPSFPLEAPESEASFDLIPPGSDPDEPMYVSAPPGSSPYAAAYSEPQQDSVRGAVSARPAPSTAELEEALEEAEFFASRGLFDDARNILVDQLARLPNHPLLRERMAEIDQQQASAKRSGSGTRERPLDEDLKTGVDRSFDIAASLDAIESDIESVHPTGFNTADKQVDVEEVFAKFKEGVAKQISIDDGQSHYDLGVAYKEMGLIDDAVREFETAARDPKRECVCRSMIGMVQLERGNLNEAIDAFMRGLHAHVRNAEQETVLCFEIGNVYEKKKMPKEALSYYQKVMRKEPNYRDVQDRVRRLAPTMQKGHARATAVGADDEFDRAFDDIIGSGKVP